jgi:transcriptional regulator with XRE-family HTH domain
MGTVDVSLMIRQRLDDLDLDQRDLARAARVTESYVSQILTRKKSPPAPERTDIYDRMDRFLKLPHGELARVAGAHIKEELRRRLGAPAALFPELRELIVRKSTPAQVAQLRAIIEQQPFGELERLVAQTLLQVAQVRGDVLYVTPAQLARLDAKVASWEWDGATFALVITLATTRGAGGNGETVKRFAYVEQAEENAEHAEGWLEFQRDPSLSGTATPQELTFLKALRFDGRRPTALYYYRELQNLRDPLHFIICP